MDSASFGKAGPSPSGSEGTVDEVCVEIFCVVDTF